ncbi:hypothetical protein D9613_007966 [Agrocybe pediades]|uniref:Uncharacterized protein n=1 Tax=Agrocybe pediades TaxID=84607 RepID=A0A8H4QND3_9AGAR|nr:hypothetical protein D9613_007966 [Agrocybe pediades]
MAFPGDGWHPRLTPYRLCVLTTTLGLGTTKAIATQKGSTVLPTTLEWISGVALFLAFFFTGKYDSQSNTDAGTHPYWSWIFRMDCMDLMWSILSRFGYRRPFYSSGEREIVPEEGQGPPVTLYRLTVSFSVLCFGMTKATLSYYGRSTSANWIDWALGAFFSSVFYCIGLYENNTLNMYPWLFEHDHSMYFHPSAKAGIFVIGTLFLWAFIMGSIYTWRIALNDDEPRFPAAHQRAGPDAIPSAWETFHDKTNDFTVSLVFLISVLFAFAVFVFMTAMMWSEDNFSRRLLADRRPTPLRRARRWASSRAGNVFFCLVLIWEKVMAKSKILRFLFSLTFLGHAVGILLAGSIGINLVGAHSRRYNQLKSLSADADPEESAWEVLRRHAEEKPKLSLAPVVPTTDNASGLSKRAEKKKAQQAKRKLKRERFKARQAKKRAAQAAATEGGKAPSKDASKEVNGPKEAKGPKESKKKKPKPAQEAEANAGPQQSAPLKKKRKHASSEGPAEDTSPFKEAAASASTVTSPPKKKSKKEKVKTAASAAADSSPSKADSTPVVTEKVEKEKHKESVKNIVRSTSDRAKNARARALGVGATKGPAGSEVVKKSKKLVEAS